MFLDGQWIDLDARHNFRRYGRILMAAGRDAADVALTTSFGAAHLTSFYVDSYELDAEGNRVALPSVRPPDAPLPEPASVNTPTQTNHSDASPTQTQAATL